MDATALFKLTYGLFIASTQWEDNRCGCVINTAAQVTDTPCRMSVTMQKRNFTTELVLKKKSLTISVLSLSWPSGCHHPISAISPGGDTDKFASVPFQTDSLATLSQGSYGGYMSLKVTDVIDLDTHYLFLCDVVEAENLDSGKPLTCGDYRAHNRRLPPPAAPAQAHQPVVKWVCPVCSLCL